MMFDIEFQSNPQKIQIEHHHQHHQIQRKHLKTWALQIGIPIHLEQLRKLEPQTMAQALQ